MNFISVANDNFPADELDLAEELALMYEIGAFDMRTWTETNELIDEIAEVFSEE